MDLNELKGLDLSNITKRDIEDLILKRSNSNYDIIISTDGASRGNPGLACGTFAIWKEGSLLHNETNIYDNMTNNLSEMTTIARAISFLESSVYNKEGINIKLINDSELCIYQITGKYKIKNEALFNVMELHIRPLLNNLKCHIKFETVPRNTREVAYCDNRNNITLDKL